MKKRILPALLALCMVMSLLPVMAFAADTEEELDPVSCSSVPNVSSVTKDETVSYTNEEGETTQVSAKVTYVVEVEGEKKCAGSCGTAGCTCVSVTKTTTEVTATEVKAALENEETEDTPEKQYTYSQTITTKYTYGEMCEKCQEAASCNPCGKGGCTLLAGHDDGEDGTDHAGQTACTNSEDDDHCTYSKHGVKCPSRCTVLDKAEAKENAAAGQEGETLKATQCSLTAGHTTPHNNTVCVAMDGCGASEHYEGELTTPGKPEDGYVKGKEPCPNLKNICGVGECPLPKGHTGIHQNTICLGVNGTKKTCNDETVTAAEHTHIAGCEWYDCECSDAHTNEDIEYGKYTGEDAIKAFASTKKCTSAAGCLLCNEWNAYVSKTNATLKAEYNRLVAEWDAKTTEQQQQGQAPQEPAYLTNACTCKVCQANPVSGTVEGETVTDPAEPTEPEQPTKAEDFSDMEDWMAADVQVVLDNGWMNGMNNGKFEGREDTTGEQVATVIARMLGADVKGGAEWQTSLQTWIDENADLLEGIEITNGAMTRKDVVLMLWRQAGKPDSDFELEFDDVDGLEGDYLTAMKWAAENGIVKGNGDGTVTPDGAVKRAELAAFAARYYALQK